MAQINLLPWREQARNSRKIQFFYAIGGVVFLSLLVVLMIHFMLSHRIQSQQARNTFLQAQIAQNQNEIVELENKLKVQNETRMHIVFLMNLQNKSFQAVRFLNELVKIMPPTITLQILKRENNKITLIGTAQSNLDITLLMTRCVNSTIFTNPILTEINATKEDPQRARTFQLTVEQKDQTI